MTPPELKRNEHSKAHPKSRGVEHRFEEDAQNPNFLLKKKNSIHQKKYTFLFFYKIMNHRQFYFFKFHKHIYIFFNFSIFSADKK